MKQQRDGIVRRATLPGRRVKEMTTRWLQPARRRAAMGHEEWLLSLDVGQWVWPDSDTYTQISFHRNFFVYNTAFTSSNVFSILTIDVDVRRTCCMRLLNCPRYHRILRLYDAPSTCLISRLGCRRQEIKIMMTSPTSSQIR